MLRLKIWAKVRQQKISELRPMRVLILAATNGELASCRRHFQQKNMDGEILFAVIGVGAVAATFFTQKHIAQYGPDVVLLGGIAGCFDRTVALGTTFAVSTDIQATLGVEEYGEWRDLFDMGFVDRDEPPYQNGRLVNPYLRQYNMLDLRIANAISVDEITTNVKRQENYIDKYHPLLESMEGAAFHFVCLRMGVAFLQVRSISNYVGDRDKALWDFPGALSNLNENLVAIVNRLVR
ncbi:MAG: futalosine hydrolase [Chitinophagaceae bacterium]